jgi:hypothetical protein
MRPLARPIALLILLLAAYLLTACALLRGDAEPVLGDVTTLTGSAILVCSQACADRGQCGTTAELGEVVLGSTFAPSTRQHDIAAPVGSLATITSMQSEPMIQSATGQEFAVNYYYLTIANKPFPAWVAGWCVTSAP